MGSLYSDEEEETIEELPEKNQMTWTSEKIEAERRNRNNAPENFRELISIKPWVGKHEQEQETGNSHHWALSTQYLVQSSRFYSYLWIIDLFVVFIVSIKKRGSLASVPCCICLFYISKLYGCARIWTVSVVYNLQSSKGLVYFIYSFKFHTFAQHISPL